MIHDFPFFEFHALCGREYPKATVFEAGYVMGPRQREVKDLRFRRIQHFSDITCVADFVDRGKRKVQRIAAERNVFVENWDHPPLETEVRIDHGDGPPAYAAKFLTFSPEWDAFLDNYFSLHNVKVLFDGRRLVVTAGRDATSRRPDDPDSLPTPQMKELAGSLFPEDLSPELGLSEGVGVEVLVNKYERNAEARRQCLAHHGYDCQVCGQCMSDIYGELGHHFAHVHHRVPLASIGAEYVVDPVRDLVPVCPNCHAMLHRTDPVLTVEALRDIVIRCRHTVAAPHSP